MNRLHVKAIDSYGFVTEGDNPEAHVAFVKTADRIATVAALKDAIDKAGDTPAPHIMARAEQLGRLDLIPDMWKQIDDDQNPPNIETHPERASYISKDDRMEYDLEGHPDREQIEKDLAELAEFRANVPAPDPVEKASPEVQAEIQKLRKTQDELQKALDRETDRRLTVEYADIAKAHPGLKGDNATEMLKSLGTANREALDWILEQVTGLEKIVAESDLFKQLGSSDGGDAAAQIEALAKELMATDKDLTLPQAKVLVRKTRPDLKDREREEYR